MQLESQLAKWQLLTLKQFIGKARASPPKKSQANSAKSAKVEQLFVASL
jgi:hypothetical protein